MTTRQPALWERLENYNFDRAEACFPYSAKVARENGWSRGHAHRVIEEYRRFAYLAIAADHPVSPPEAVDQAWHIHILYTREYNEVFCPEVLGRHLHHGPSIGGRAEEAKHQDWYERTLASYREHFGEPPPRDIWPTPAERAATRSRFERVDRARHWVIKKPRPRRIPAWLGLAAIPFVVHGCSPGIVASSPLDYDGRSFLRFYVVSFLCTFLVALLVRHLQRHPGPRTGENRRLEPDELASLNGGPNLVFQTVLASLARKGLIEIKDGKVRNVGAAGAVKLTRMEKLVVSAVGGEEVPVEPVKDALKGRLDALESRLQADGLLMSDRDATISHLLPLFLALLVPALGLVKLIVGLQRDRPVGLLLLLLLISGVAVTVAFGSRKRRSRYGDQVLARSRANLRSYRTVGTRLDAAPNDLAFGVALFGLAALAGAPEHKMLKPVAGQAGIDDSPEISACGADGGGGGSDGGGGGCGGCGGD